MASVSSSLVPLLGTNAVQHSTKSTLGRVFQLHIFEIIEPCSELCSSSLSDLHVFHVILITSSVGCISFQR